MSQTAQIRAWFERGRSLTPLEALENFGCFRLAARVRDLKDSGYPIEMRRIETPSGKHVAKYWKRR